MDEVSLIYVLKYTWVNGCDGYFWGDLHSSYSRILIKVEVAVVADWRFW